MATLGSPLDELLSSKARVRVLRAALTRMEQEPPDPEPDHDGVWTAKHDVHARFGQRELEVETGLSKRAVHLAVRELMQVGVLERDAGSSRSQFRVNIHHELAGSLAALFASETTFMSSFFDALRALLEQASQAAHASLLWGRCIR